MAVRAFMLKKKKREVGNFLCSLQYAKARGEAEPSHAMLVVGKAGGARAHGHHAKPRLSCRRRPEQPCLPCLCAVPGPRWTCRWPGSVLQLGRGCLLPGVRSYNPQRARAEPGTGLWARRAKVMKVSRLGSPGLAEGTERG